MKISYPDYYSEFTCIAAACPDSCCHEWEVDIDEETAAFYRTLPGDLGDRLRQVLKDTPEGTSMEIVDRRCPMWRQDGLCRIQAELGHDALCKTCREFPRIKHDYGTFAEYGLELSCPEAARLILQWDGTTVGESQPGDSDPDYDETDMAFLLKSRQTILDYLNTTEDTPGQMLARILLYGQALQEQWDGGGEAVFPACPQLSGGDPGPLFAFFSGLEILTDRWRALLAKPPKTARLPRETKALMRYFIYRHWLQAVSDFDLFGRVCFCVAACIMIGSVDAPTEQAAQLFSKEIENDVENLYAFWDATYTDPTLSADNLLALLPKN